MRNYGIDLLRILSIFMIVLLHILGHGGVLASVEKANYWIAWLVEIACFCAVNCYALISGYVGVKSKYKISNCVYIWLQALFYTLLLSSIYLIFDRSLLSKGYILHAILPISTQQYWYLTAYVGLYVFMPLLNILLNHARRSQLSLSIFLIILLFSIIPTLLRIDLFYLNYGYSMIWLIVLYIIGGYIKLYGFPFVNTKSRGIIVYIGCIFFTFFTKYLIEVPISNYLGDYKGGGVFVEYTSTTILFCGIGLLVFFSKLKMNEKMNRLIEYITPSTFSVYLIHEFYLIRENFVSNKFVNYSDNNFIVMIIKITVTACIIFTICIGIDQIRLFIFNKFKVKERLNQLEYNFNKIVN